MERGDIPRIVVRLGNIKFTQDSIDTWKAYGVMVSRARGYVKDSVVINHGNSKNFKVGRGVRRLYLLNHPKYIEFSVDKWKGYTLLKPYYPETYLASDYDGQLDYPFVAKPVTGYHGYGFQIIHDDNELEKVQNLNRPYILQEYLERSVEHRFNVIDGEIYQVSKRIVKDGMEGGCVRYKSLGRDAKLSEAYWDFVHRAVNDFSDAVEDKIASYCIDVMKSKDGLYYLSETNTAFGVGGLTVEKLLETLRRKYDSGDLEKYRVR